MNVFKRLRRISGLLAVLGVPIVALASAGPAAMARVPPSGGFGAAATTSQPVVVSHPVIYTVSSGMPGWQIALIAIGAALAAAVCAVLADRALSARRRLAAAS
jgi:hypothetical protein